MRHALVLALLCLASPAVAQEGALVIPPAPATPAPSAEAAAPAPVADPKAPESAETARATLPAEVVESLRLGSEAYGMGGGLKAIGVVQIVAGAGLLVLGLMSQDDKSGVGFVPGAVTLGAGALFTGIGASYSSSGDAHFEQVATGKKTADAAPKKEEAIRYGIFDAPEK